MSNTDLLGRPLTAVELEVEHIHERLHALCSRPELAPCVASNAKHALAALWQIMNDLNLVGTHPSRII